METHLVDISMTPSATMLVTVPGAAIQDPGTAAGGDRRSRQKGETVGSTAVLYKTDEKVDQDDVCGCGHVNVCWRTAEKSFLCWLVRRRLISRLF